MKPGSCARTATLTCSILLTTTLSSSPVLSASEQAPFQPDDLFKLESIDSSALYGGAFAFSPDGRRIAYVKARPRATTPSREFEKISNEANRNEVWVQLEEGAKPINIAHETTDHAGWWSPLWSPDSSKLAVLSTRGNRVGLWLWDASTRALTLLCDRSSWTTAAQPFIWLDEKRLLYFAQPDDVRARETNNVQNIVATATAAWKSATEGTISTASILQSGVPESVVDDLHSNQQLLLLDVAGKARLISEGVQYNWSLSPDRSQIAYEHRLGLVSENETQQTTYESAIEVVKLNGQKLRLEGYRFHDVSGRGLLRWSPDSRQLAFLAAMKRHEPPKLYQWNVRANKVIVHPLRGLNTAGTGLDWTSNGGLLLQARQQQDGSRNSSSTQKLRLWLITAKGSPKPLTSEQMNTSLMLVPESERGVFFGASDGKFWKIDPIHGRVTDLTPQLAQPLDQKLAWPKNYGVPSYDYSVTRTSSGYSRIVLKTDGPARIQFYEADLQTGSLHQLQSPTPDAELVAYSPVTRSAVFLEQSDRDGLRVWRTSGPVQSAETLLETNTFLRNLRTGEWQLVEYTSLAGEPLKAWLLLPHNYRSGQRYPLLTWVYPETVVEGTLSDYEREVNLANSSSFTNMQVASGHGYAVLFPSMPMGPYGGPEDIMFKLPEGVMPAIDKAIALGIADPNQLLLAGVSFGGFATYGLVTQTNRFKAAAALMGFCDLVSAYGTFNGLLRYTDRPHRDIHGSFSMPSYMEKGIVRLGSTPWEDPDRYVRNSPILYANKVQTPVLIVHGDLDLVPMGQAEEFFRALYRQGKPAMFVRYWGEAHALESPANIRDFWRRIFDWFDRHSNSSSNAS